MPKSKANNTIQIGQKNLIDASAMAAIVGYTAQFVNRAAAQGLIPWHGIRNGKKIYRRFDPEAVLAALAHGVDKAS